jgi:nicotinate phosphoribosyltransferase
MAFGDEIDAFRKFGAIFPSAATLLVDTYDTVQGVKNAMASGSPMQAVRLDSGDLGQLSKKVRRILDAAGRKDVQIVASGDLNEYRIAELLAAGSPIDVFGVGTELVTSRDEPTLGTVYKLVEQQTGAGTVGRFKLSPDKATYPFAKQVYRQTTADGRFAGDVIARSTEPSHGEPLLVPVMRNGQLISPLPSLRESQQRFLAQREWLPDALRSLGQFAPYPVRVSDELERALHQMASGRETASDGGSDSARA